MNINTRKAQDRQMGLTLIESCLVMTILSVIFIGIAQYYFNSLKDIAIRNSSQQMKEILSVAVKCVKQDWYVFEKDAALLNGKIKILNESDCYPLLENINEHQNSWRQNFRILLKPDILTSGDINSYSLLVATINGESVDQSTLSYAASLIGSVGGISEGNKIIGIKRNWDIDKNSWLSHTSSNDDQDVRQILFNDGHLYAYEKIDSSELKLRILYAQISFFKSGIEYDASRVWDISNINTLNDYLYINWLASDNVDRVKIEIEDADFNSDNQSKITDYIKVKGLSSVKISPKVGIDKASNIRVILIPYDENDRQGIKYIIADNINVIL